MTDAETKCLFVCPHYRPLIGGALAVYDALATCEPQQIQVLTAYIDYTSGEEVEAWRQFDAGAPYTVRRLPRLRPNLTSGHVSIPARIRNKLIATSIQRKVWQRIQDIAAQEGITHICIGALDALGWLASRIKKHPALKSVLYVHGEEVTQKTHSATADRARKQAFMAADATVVVSSFTANAVINLYGIDRGKISCITNGVDLEMFKYQAQQAHEKPATIPAGRFVFSCGRLVARKGFDKLVEAWPIIKKECPDVTLCIGGDGPMREALEDRIGQLELHHSIKMLGRVASGDLPEFYRHADVFASPNRTMPDGDTEGFGLVFLEAAAVGTPSIGGDAGGVPDAIQDGVTGLLVDGNNPADIADALIRLLSDEALLKTMSKNALSHAQTQGWQSKSDEFMTVLNNIG
ncbi:glycosyltransferase family 4 protein [Kordiimonas aquimaris]|uniref:glycosyltransferase family 4 protein n=1 Tax=Kordiimonas aquimaris TaxID=707591 RepID=UPI0021D23D21|nr:glycosyltransferase family 4 protein [Kordiimonas aquimaris]